MTRSLMIALVLSGAAPATAHAQIEHMRQTIFGMD